MDIIQSEHTNELNYPCAKMIAERIESRIGNIFSTQNIKALPDSGKEYHIQVQLHEQDLKTMTFKISINNQNTQSWIKEQICVSHHWLSNSGILIEYANNKSIINQDILPQQTNHFLYSIKQINEPGQFTLRFTLLDNYGSWFNDHCDVGISRKIDSYGNE